MGEHVAIIGVTGRGKTTFALDILAGRLNTIPRSRVLIFANKPRDRTLRNEINSGRWVRIKEWPPHYEHRVNRAIILWPPYPSASTAPKRNRPVFTKALDGVLSEGDWTIYLDETNYLVEQMHMREMLDEYWNSARSSDVSVVAGAQRPVWTSRSMTSQHSWVVFFHIRDEDERLRAGELAGSKRDVANAIGRLGKHEFLIINTGNGQGYISELTR